MSESELAKAEILRQNIVSIATSIKNMELEDGISYLESIMSYNMITQLNIEKPALSGLKIDDRLRLILVDFNTEIKIDPLTKAIYFLFLIHHDGLPYLHLDIYQSQIMEIYKLVADRGDLKKLMQSVELLTAPYSDTLYQKMSRLRNKLSKFFPRKIVNEYYIPRKLSDTDEDIRKIFLPQDIIQIPNILNNIKNIKTNVPNDSVQYRYTMPKISKEYFKPSEIHYDDKANQVKVFLLK